MKILILIERIPPYCGGAEQVAWMQALTLAKNNDVFIMTFGDRNCRKRRDGIEIIFLKKQKHQLLYFAKGGMKYLNELVQRINPDIIQSHMPNILHLFISTKYPLFTTIHDGVPEGNARKLNKLRATVWVKNSIIRKLNVYKSDRIICVSRHNYRYMINRYKYKKKHFSVIENPINDTFFTGKGGSRGEYILNFGRQIHLKMAALIETARMMPNLKFKFIGSGPMVKDYGLKNVEFLGFHSEVIRWIDNALICVFPSKSENFPLSGLEAMARGKPVIATEMGFSEYITNNENGIIIPDNRPETIKEAIERILSDKRLFESICKNARRKAKEYRCSYAFKRYLNLYDRYLNDDAVVKC